MPPVNSITEPLDDLLKLYTLGKNIDAVMIDIHGEATSEKIALGYYLDGRVSLVAGTHTHVSTADARILPQKTGYITDVGMCGDFESVLDFEPQAPMERLAEKLTLQNRLTLANGKKNYPLGRCSRNWHRGFMPKHYANQGNLPQRLINLSPNKKASHSKQVRCFFIHFRHSLRLFSKIHHSTRDHTKKQNKYKSHMPHQHF